MVHWRAAVIIFSMFTFILVIYPQWETIVKREDKELSHSIQELKNNNTHLQQRIVEIESMLLILNHFK